MGDTVEFGDGVSESFELYEMPLRVQSVDDPDCEDFSLVGLK